MARIAGINIPMNKHVWVGLTHIYGVGRTRARECCSLANVNPTFNWVRLAQRIPVRISIDDISKGVTLSAGMTATVVVTEPDNASRVKPPAR